MNAPRTGCSALFRLRTAGRDGGFGTRDDRALRIGIQAYDASKRTVTLALSRRYTGKAAVQLVVAGRGAGVASASGVALDGNRDGKPGDDFLGLISKT